MGHDIYAYSVGPEVAYLRRNMSSGTIHDFYRALNATEHDGGVSGYGTGSFFYKEDIENAVNALKASTDRLTLEKDYDAEMKFFDEVLTFFEDNPEHDRVYIYFG